MNFKERVSFTSTVRDVVRRFIGTQSKVRLTRLRIKGIRKDVWIRKESALDKEVLTYVFDEFHGQYHLPPKQVQLREDCIIVDLGSNIGLTIVHFKNLYPQSIIFGFEMDKENYEIAQLNCLQYKSVKLFNEAVWVHNESVFYDKGSNSDAFSAQGQNFFNGRSVEVKSTTIPNIIKANNLSKIDYLKMDIEGAEKNIFQSDDLSWLSYVDAINVEVHDQSEMKITEYIKILNEHGFEAWKDDKHWSAVIARRKT